jgi:hypothetical protein
MLSALVVTLAFYFLWEGRTQAINDKAGGSWQSKYWQMDSSQLGAAMLGVFAWDTAFIASDRIINAMGGV